MIQIRTGFIKWRRKKQDCNDLRRKEGVKKKLKQTTLSEVMCGDKSLEENGVLDAEGNQSGDLGNVDKRDTENIHKMKGKNQ